MRLFRFLSFVLIIFSINSCGNDREPIVRFSIEADIDIPAGRNALITHVFILRNVFPLAGNQVSSTTKDLITEVLSTRGMLTGRFTTIDFSIIDDISIWAVSRQTPDLSKEVFYRENIPFDERGDLLLFSSLSNTADILLDDTVDLEVRLRFKNITSFPLEGKLLLGFEGF